MIDEEVRDGWAAASIRLEAADVTSIHLPPSLANRARISRTKKIMTFEIDNSAERPLTELLQSATSFISEHFESLAGVPDCVIDLFLGWSPKAPQEALVINEELLRLLSRLKASIVFDTYSA